MTVFIAFQKFENNEHKINKENSSQNTWYIRGPLPLFLPISWSATENFHIKVADKSTGLYRVDVGQHLILMRPLLRKVSKLGFYWGWCRWKALTMMIKEMYTTTCSNVTGEELLVDILLSFINSKITNHAGKTLWYPVVYKIDTLWITEKTVHAWWNFTVSSGISEKK